MSLIPRNDTSILGRWWNEVDQGQIWTVLILILAGWVIMFTGSAQEALQDNQPLLNFSARKALIVFAGLIIMFGASLVPPSIMPLITRAGFALALLLLLSLFIFGVSKNGATRWLAVPGLPFAPQPTEFVKPFFVLIVALCLAKARDWGFASAFWAAAACCGIVAALIITQPDVSQTAFIVVVFLVMVFMGGLALEWVVVLGGFASAAAVTLYFTIPHVRYRVDGFWMRTTGQDGNLRDHNDMAEDAFRNGGVEGLGLGEGRLKTSIPEAKNDMPLAIIGEEMGLIGALVVFGFFILVWTRTQRRLANMSNDFQRLGAIGLAFLLIAQALINIFYTIGLIPTTGITLPFFSDGGSSLIASALTVGFLLSLTRQRAPHMAGQRV